MMTDGSCNPAFAPFSIRVPASTSNMAVGYDVLGMAVNLHSEFSFRPAQKLAITGCPAEYCNEDNLVHRAYLHACEALEVKPVPYALEIRAQAPVARGLGSSSTCIVAGIMAAMSMAGIMPDRKTAVRLATQMEGHPDNAAPAVLGSLVCSFTPEDGDPVCIPLAVHPDLRFVTLIPDYEVKTHDARKAVPETVSTKTAVWQMGRVAAVTHALQTGDMEILAAAMDDRIQEPFRKHLIPEYDSVKEICRRFGGTMWISGSGSTLMAAIKGDEAAARLADVLRDAWPAYEVKVLTCDDEGASVSADLVCQLGARNPFAALEIRDE